MLAAAGSDGGACEVGQCNTVPLYVTASVWAAGALRQTPRIDSTPIVLGPAGLRNYGPILTASRLQQHSETWVFAVLWVPDSNDHVLSQHDDEAHQALGREILQASSH